MTTFRGMEGFLVLGGLLLGSPLVDGAVAPDATTMGLYGLSLLGVSAPGDQFIIGGDTYTVTSGFIPAVGNLLPAITFTPGAIGGFSSGASVIYLTNTIAQTRQWNLTPSMDLLNTTAQGMTWEGRRTGLAKWLGSFEALLDLSDPEQAALIAHLTGATPATTTVSLFFGIQAGTARGFYGGAIVSSDTIPAPLRDLVSLQIDFASDGLVGIGWPEVASCTPVPVLLQTNLAICLDLGETSGTRYDSVGTTDMAPLNSVGWRPGKGGLAAHFDATLFQSLSALSADTTFNAGDFTWGFWVKPGVLGVAQSLLSQGRNTAAGQYEWFIELRADGHLRLTFGAAGAGFITSSTAILTVGMWAFVMVWHDGVNLYLQVNNGTIDSSAGNVWIVEGGLPFQIGAIGQDNDADHAANNDFFTGDIQAVMLWRDRVLTQPERDQIWNTGVGCRCICP